jgi:hypothetical protein
MSVVAYAGDVESVNELEDSRGVDIGQIRRQLRLSVPERVQSMVATANVMLSIQKSAQASLRRRVN